MLGNDQNDPFAFIDADEPVKQPGLKGRKSHSDAGGRGGHRSIPLDTFKYEHVARRQTGRNNEKKSEGIEILPDMLWLRDQRVSGARIVFEEDQLVFEFPSRSIANDRFERCRISISDVEELIQPPPLNFEEESGFCVAIIKKETKGLKVIGKYLGLGSEDSYERSILWALKTDLWRQSVKRLRSDYGHIRYVRFECTDPIHQRLQARMQDLIRNVDEVAVKEVSPWTPVQEGDLDGTHNPARRSLSPCQTRREAVFMHAPLVYPTDDHDAVTIQNSDLETLEPDVYLNDTIIDFYIKHLQVQRFPELGKQFYFFNSFFFKKLSDSYPLKRVEGEEPYEKLKKWTRNVNIFEYEYLIIPVNESFHWSLVIVCPAKITEWQDSKKQQPQYKSSRRPISVLHLDSLIGVHVSNSVLKTISQYLCDAYIDHHNVDPQPTRKDFSPKILKAQVPQQPNYYDCGIYLLHYLEHFIKEVGPTQPPALSNDREEPFPFLTSSWFPQSATNDKRERIRCLVIDLYKACATSPDSSARGAALLTEMNQSQRSSQASPEVVMQERRRQAKEMSLSQASEETLPGETAGRRRHREGGVKAALQFGSQESPTETDGGKGVGGQPKAAPLSGEDMMRACAMGEQHSEGEHSAQFNLGGGEGGDGEGDDDVASMNLHRPLLSPTPMSIVAVFKNCTPEAGRRMRGKEKEAGILQQPHQLHVDTIPEHSATALENGFSNSFTDAFRDGQPFSQPTSPKLEFSQFGAAGEAAQGRLRADASATLWGLIPEGRLGGRLGGNGEAVHSEEEQEVIVPESDSEEQCMHPVASGWKERRGWDSELVGLLGSDSPPASPPHPPAGGGSNPLPTHGNWHEELNPKPGRAEEAIGVDTAGGRQHSMSNSPDVAEAVPESMMSLARHMGDTAGPTSRLPPDWLETTKEETQELESLDVRGERDEMGSGDVEKEEEGEKVQAGYESNRVDCGKMDLREAEEKEKVEFEGRGEGVASIGNDSEGVGGAKGVRECEALRAAARAILFADESESGEGEGGEVGQVELNGKLLRPDWVPAADESGQEEEGDCYVLPGEREQRKSVGADGGMRFRNSDGRGRGGAECRIDEGAECIDLCGVAAGGGAERRGGEEEGDVVLFSGSINRAGQGRGEQQRQVEKDRQVEEDRQLAQAFQLQEREGELGIKRAKASGKGKKQSRKAGVNGSRRKSMRLRSKASKGPPAPRKGGLCSISESLTSPPASWIFKEMPAETRGEEGHMEADPGGEGDPDWLRNPAGNVKAQRYKKRDATGGKGQGQGEKDRKADSSASDSISSEVECGGGVGRKDRCDGEVSKKNDNQGAHRTELDAFQKLLRGGKNRQAAEGRGSGEGVRLGMPSELGRNGVLGARGDLHGLSAKGVHERRGLANEGSGGNHIGEEEIQQEGGVDGQSFVEPIQLSSDEDGETIALKCDPQGSSKVSERRISTPERASS